MSFLEGMRGCGVPSLGVRDGFSTEMHSWAMRVGLGGDVSTRVIEVVRGGAGDCTGLVCGYLAGAIDTKCYYKRE